MIENELQYFFRNAKRSDITNSKIIVKTISHGTSQKNLLLKMAHGKTKNQLSAAFVTFFKIRRNADLFKANLFLIHFDSALYQICTDIN